MASSSPRIAIIFGTRPEAIKLAPLARAAAAFDDWEVEVWATGQHQQLVAGIAAELELVADVHLEAMRPGQSLTSLSARLLDQLGPTIAERRPTWLIVQGDTTTAMIGAMAGFYGGVRVAHVEAGLRTGDRSAPYPEEVNRALISRLADLHLAPTPRAQRALLAEGIDPGSIEVTGNTVVDALRWIVGRLPADGSPPVSGAGAGAGAGEGDGEGEGEGDDLRRFFGDPRRRLVLITGHRRESFAGGLVEICDGLAQLAQRWPAVDFVYPVHLNPAVQRAVHGRLAGLKNVHLLAPVGYAAAIWLLRRATFVITDSGGIQEEAPELGKPALVTRASTERPEALEQGYARLVGFDAAAMIEAADRWLGDPVAYAEVCPRPGAGPFGDGRAADRCVAALRRRLGLAVGVEAPPWP